MFNYSIVIRTLGNTGDKYRTMLNAIDQQTIKPKEVVVVIPHGYTLDHILGYERVIYCEKGMVTQRAVGIAEAVGDYLLVLDDDLDFPDDFAEKLYLHLKTFHLDCVLTFGDWMTSDELTTAAVKVSFKEKILDYANRIRKAYTGQAFYSRRKSEYFDTIVSTGGHRTYVNCEDKLCQAGAFACFFIDAAKAKCVHFEEEKWLEQGSISNYAAYDDAVFFYKLFLRHGRIAYTRSTCFKHLDAATGRPAKGKLMVKRIRLYTIARNRTIFWHRHIWSNHRSLHNLAGGIYGIVNYAFYNLVINMYPKYWPAIGAMFQGYCDAFRYIRKS